MSSFLVFTVKIAIYSFIYSIPLLILAAETKGVVATKNSKPSTLIIHTSKKDPLVIESQVKGSQEQPKVIYVMPWQNIENPIIIEGNNQKIILPDFKPINPKTFKKQSMHFYKVNLKKIESNKK